MKVIYLSSLALFVITLSTLLANQTSVSQAVNLQPTSEVETQSVATKIIPLINDNVAFPIFSAQSVMAIDVDSGTPLFEKNPDGKLFPASTTKIITYLVAKDVFALDSVLTVGRVSVEGQKMGLVQGEAMRVEDLLYGLLVYSANDAAEVLAANFPGGRALFVEAMNQKAKDIGLTSSHFKNPSGLDEDGHLTTARDLGVATKQAMRDEFFRIVVATKDKEVKSVNGKIVHHLTNVNKLLGEVDGVMGVKTGWTEFARENLVTYVQKDGKTVSIVLLGSKDRFGETKELIDWIFDNYAWQSVKLTSVN